MLCNEARQAMKRGAFDKATKKYAFISTTHEPCCAASIAEFAHSCLLK